MNSKELFGIALLVVGTAVIFGITSLGAGLVANALGGLATLALAGGALMYGTADDGRPV